MTNFFSISVEEQVETVPVVVTEETPTEPVLEETILTEEESTKLESEIQDHQDTINQGMELVEGMESLAYIASKIDNPTPIHIALFRTAANMAVAGSNYSAEAFLPAMESNKPIALEGFVEKTKEIKQRLNIAKENIIKTSINAIEDLFTSDNKILTSLKELENKDAINESVLENPVWSSVFLNVGKNEINGKDIISFINEINTTRNSLIKDVEETIKICKQLLPMIKVEGDPEDNPEDDKKYKDSIFKISEHKETLDNIYLKIEKILKLDNKNIKKLNIKTANKEEIKKLISIVKNIFNNKSYQDHVEKLGEEFYDIYGKILNGLDYYDTKSEYASEALQSANDCIYVSETILYKILNIESKITYSIYKYLKASVK